MRRRSLEVDEDEKRSPNIGMPLQLRVTARRSSKRFRDICVGDLANIKRRLKQDPVRPGVDCPLPCNGARVRPDSAQVGDIRLEDGDYVGSLDNQQTLTVNGVQALETTAQPSATSPDVQQPQRLQCDPGACFLLGPAKNLESSPAKADVRETPGVLAAPTGAMTSSTAGGARCQAPHLTNTSVLDAAAAASVADGLDQKAQAGCPDAQSHQGLVDARGSHSFDGTTGGQPQATQTRRTTGCNRLPGLRTMATGPGHLGLYLRPGQGLLPLRSSGGDAAAAIGKSGLGLRVTLGQGSSGASGRIKQQLQDHRVSELPILLPQAVVAAAPPVEVQNGSSRVQAAFHVAAGSAGALAATGGGEARGAQDMAAGATGAATAEASGSRASEPLEPTAGDAAAAVGGDRAQGAPHPTPGTTTAAAGTSAPGGHLAPKTPPVAPAAAAAKGAAAAACRVSGVGRSAPLVSTTRGRCRPLMEFDDWLQWLHRGKERRAGLGMGQGRERAAGSVFSTGERGLLVSVDGNVSDSETESEGGACSSPSSGDTDGHSSGCGSDGDRDDGSCSTYGVTLEEPQEEDDGGDTETERKLWGGGGTTGNCSAAARGADHSAAGTCQAVRAPTAAGATAAAAAADRTGALKRSRPQRGMTYGPPWMLVPRTGRALRFSAGAASALWPHLMGDPGARKTRLPVTLHVVDLQGHSSSPMQAYMRCDDVVGSQMVLRGFPRWPLVPGAPWNALLQIGPHPSGDGALVQLAGPLVRVQHSLRTGKLPPMVPQEAEEGGGGDRLVRVVGSCGVDGSGGNGGGNGGGASSAATRTLRVRLRQRLFRRSFHLDLPTGTAQLMFGHLVEAHALLQEGRGALGEEEEARRGAAATPGALVTAGVAEAPVPGAAGGAAAAGGDRVSGPPCGGAIPFKALQITLIAEAWPESKFQVELRYRFPGVLGLPYSACRPRAILGGSAMGPVVLYGGQAGDILELWHKPGGRPEEFVCRVVRMDGKGVGGAAA